jgi:hypothetical protein
VIEGPEGRKSINLPLYFRSLYEKSVGSMTDDAAGLKCALKRPLFNRLMLDGNEFEAGYCDCQDIFLCAEIDDEDLPWNVNETKW